MAALRVRRYGQVPFGVVVVHGGPGAGGEMAPVARELARDWGVLEPIQTATTLDGQVEELRAVLAAHAETPAALVGYSWGAWLSYLVAARHPALVRRLVLVSSGPFETRYLPALQAARLQGLSAEEAQEFATIAAALDDPATAEKDRLLARLGALASQADTYAPLPDAGDEALPDSIAPSGDIFQAVWGAAAELRRSGELLALGRQIRCPVVAIHGADDPHPAEGVRAPLSEVVADFRFELLARCGHTPWRERYARDPFYARLRAALR